MRRPFSYRTTILAALLFTASFAMPAIAPAGQYAELGNNTYASLFAAQPDGKLLLSGSTDSCAPFEACVKRQLFVARLLRSGEPDRDFGGGDGIAAIPVKGSPPRITDAALQPNGRIVVAGSLWADDGVTSFVARLRPNGRPDRGFGSAGSIELPIDITYDGGLAIDGEGRIVVVGSTYPDFAVAALLPSGQPDETFGTDGVVLGRFAPTADNDYAEGLAILDGNRILISGTSEIGPSESYIGLAQMRPNGSLDSQFGGGDGLAIGPGIQGQTGENLGRDQSGGSPVVSDDGITIVGHAGSSGWHTCPSGLLTRFDRDGSWDPTYGSAGTRLFRCTSGFQGLSTPVGDVLASGTADFYDLTYPRIGRFRADGKPDLDFNRGTGLRGLRPAGLEGWGTGLVQAPRSVFFSASMIDRECAGMLRSGPLCHPTTITKLRSDGSLDRSFGTAGIASLPPVKICRRAPFSPCKSTAARPASP